MAKVQAPTKTIMAGGETRAGVAMVATIEISQLNNLEISTANKSNVKSLNWLLVKITYLGAEAISPSRPCVYLLSPLSSLHDLSTTALSKTRLYS